MIQFSPSLTTWDQTQTLLQLLRGATLVERSHKVEGSQGFSSEKPHVTHAASQLLVKCVYPAVFYSFCWWSTRKKAEWKEAAPAASPPCSAPQKTSTGSSRSRKPSSTGGCWKCSSLGCGSVLWCENGFTNRSCHDCHGKEKGMVGSVKTQRCGFVDERQIVVILNAQQQNSPVSRNNKICLWFSSNYCCS